MANPWYTRIFTFTPRTRAAGSQVRSEYDNIEDAFDALVARVNPTPSVGNAGKAAVVNAGGTAYETDSDANINEGDTGTSGTKIPYLDGNNTWSGNQTIGGAISNFLRFADDNAPVADEKHWELRSTLGNFTLRGRDDAGSGQSATSYVLVTRIGVEIDEFNLLGDMSLDVGTVTNQGAGTINAENGVHHAGNILVKAKNVPGGTAESELTIVSGVITPTGASHTVDTESDAGTDDLDNILQTNMDAGSYLVIRPEHDDRTVVVKHNQGGAGEILLHGDVDASLLSTDDVLVLQRVGTTWEERWRSRPGNAGGAVYATASGASYGDSATIQFGSELYDVRSEFDDSTGIFTASGDGLYSLYTHIDPSGLTAGSEWHIQFQVTNNTGIGAATTVFVSQHITDDTPDSRLWVSITYPLKSGAIVVVRTDRTAGSGTLTVAGSTTNKISINKVSELPAGL